MNIVNNTSSLSTVFRPAGAVRSAAPLQPNPSRIMAEDTVEFSTSGRSLARAVEESSFRIARVRAVSAAIADGTYETRERLDGAVSRLLDVLG